MSCRPEENRQIDHRERIGIMCEFRITDLKVEHQREVLGLDIAHPRFSWILKSEQKNTMQTAYQIVVKAGEETVWHSQVCKSSQSIEIEYAGKELKPMTVYLWQVTVWDNHGHCAVAESHWETGRFTELWQSLWVEPLQQPTEKIKQKPIHELMSEEEANHKKEERDYAEFFPAHYIRIPFKVKATAKTARIYATAHGIYQLYINGEPADDRRLAPEMTSYQSLLQYQVYDITDKLLPGENVIGLILSDGWWSGRVGLTGEACQYGSTIGYLLEGRIVYPDGEVEIISGEKGVSATGPICYSDLFVGERYDARLENPDWCKAGYDDTNWQPVIPKDYPTENVKAQYGEPVRPILSFQPTAVLTTPVGETVLDLGQNIAGYVSFTINAPAGLTIKLEHSEVLDENGNFLNNIIGVNKDQTDYYITKEGEQSYQPIFTYHGFRYVKISGWPGTPEKQAFTATVISSEMEDIGTFETSDERINRLQKNIWWSQVANTISIPTDCPQRERVGWTGDIMAFAPTMSFNRNAAAFLTRWLECCRIEQRSDGQIPIVVPYLEAYQNNGESHSSCGWSDAIVAVPWALYQAYGDEQVLRENYQAMLKWMAYVENQAETGKPDGYDTFDEVRKERQKYLWNTGFHFGDWLIPSLVLNNSDGKAMMQTATATMGIVAPAYYAFNTAKMAEIAETLGRTDDASYYRELNKKIRTAFIEEYVHEDGTLDANFQGIYIICLKNGLVTDEQRPKMIAHLRKMIAENNGCLDTGFLSILFLMDVLCENDCADVAYSLLFQEQCPSWLYQVKKGATTMWESWGAITPEDKVSSYSYNHYAFGCVGEWLYRVVGGLQAAAPGYKYIRIAPAVDCGLKSARTTLKTPYGLAGAEWKLENGTVELKVMIPANTTAEVQLPEQAIAVDSSLKIADGCCRIGSGTYQFTYQI